MNTQLTEHPRLQVEMILASLYLRGAPRNKATPKYHALSIFDLLKNKDLTLEQMISFLHQQGYIAETKILENNDLLEWSKKEILSNKVMTFASEYYPKQWADKLGVGAPPALWKKGDFPPGPFLGVVGSQNILPPDQNFSFECGKQIISLGYSFVSGGARGADTWGAKGAFEMSKQLFNQENHEVFQKKIVELLPYGLSRNTPYIEKNFKCELSICEPDARFSTAHAMERNILIYALSEVTIVVRAKLYKGGSWHGATSALKRKITHLLVQNDPLDSAMQALIAKGGIPLFSPDLLDESIQFLPVMQNMFS